MFVALYKLTNRHNRTKTDHHHLFTFFQIQLYFIFQAKNQLFFSKPILVHHEGFIFLFLPLKCSKLWFHRAIMTLRHSAIFAKDDFQSHHIILIFICHRPRARIPKKKFLNIRVLNFTSRFFCLLRYAN